MDTTAQSMGKILLCGNLSDRFETLTFTDKAKLMFISRSELRNVVSRIDAYITHLRVKNPADADFVQSTGGVFSEVLTQCDREDGDWLFNAIDQVCTRHQMPYPDGTFAI
jgi:hypothetical protein